MIQKEYLCDQIDDYIADKPIWIVTLDNGRKIYQDDYREGSCPPQAWLRLKKHCFELKTKIKHVQARFKSHLINPVPNDCLLYSFIKSLVNINLTSNIHCYSFGYLTSQLEFYIARWMVPELELESINRADLTSHKDLLIFGEAWQNNNQINHDTKVAILQILGLPLHNI